MASRSKAGLVILIIGILVLVLTPIWRWVIGPSMVKLPDTLDSISVYDGTLTLYVDPTTLTILPADMAVKIPLQITRHDLSLPDKSSSSVAVVQETVKAIGPAGKTFIDTSMDYALDRKTSENVKSPEADEDRTGWYPLLPIGAAKITYPIWGNDTKMTGDANYVEEVKVAGINTPPSTCYVYKVEGKPDKMPEPPLGLPKTIPGAMIKQLITQVPGAPSSIPFISDTEEVPITYLMQTTATIVGEPRTGTIVDVDNTDNYYIDTSALGIPNLKLATIHYVQTKENVKQLMDDASENWILLDTVYVWVPLGMLILGIILTAIGGIWFSRKKAPA